MRDLNDRISELNELITNDKILVNYNGDTNFKIFDYDPEDRYKVLNYLYNFIYVNNQNKILIIDIYKTIIDILNDINYIDIILDDEKKYGTAYANKIIQDVLGIGTRNEDLLKNKILELIKKNQKKIVVLIGLEGCYQIIRGHTILSILESQVTDNSIIMFYPGTYDGQTFRLFNRLDNDNGYNAMIVAGR